MFQLSAPYPSLQTTTILPSPKFSDQDGITDTVAIVRATDGTLYSYVKTRDLRESLQWPFRLTRNKALELRAFILSYFASQVQILDHLGQTWVGNITADPFEFSTTTRSAPAITPLPRGEWVEISLPFEGTLVS